MRVDFENKNLRRAGRDMSHVLLGGGAALSAEAVCLPAVVLSCFTTLSCVIFISVQILPASSVSCFLVKSISFGFFPQTKSGIIMENLFL